MKPQQLRCEYLENPLGIDTLRPRLSWIVGNDQTAYQIAATSDQKECWNSGKIKGNQTTHIEYAGKPLESGQRISWKVRAWDRDDRVSEWSEAGWWEMGLLAKEDWHGRWIARTGETSVQAAPFFRREFTVDQRVKRARIYLCGLGYYEVSINGRKIGDHVLDPGYTRYDKRVLYVTYDVTEELRAGLNAVGVILGTGWYNVHTLAVWDFHLAPWRKSPRLLLEMRIDFEDGTSRQIVSDGSWKTSTGPILFDSIYSGETYDARLEKPGWDNPGYDDREWQNALLVDEPGGRITAQQMRAIKVTHTLASKTVTESKPGVYVFDIGENIAGWPQIAVSGPAGAQIVMDCGERLYEDGTLDQEHIAKYVKERDASQTFQRNTYILKGQGTEIWEPRFTYQGFQYVQMTGFPGHPETQALHARVLHTAVERTGSFECSDELLNRIWKNTLRAFVSNLHGIPTDCPHREKNGWTGDAHLAAEQAMFNFDMAAVYAKWLNDIQDNQRTDGAFSGIIPSGDWGYPTATEEYGPSWDSVCVLMPWYLYLYYGDIRVLDRHYGMMVRYLDYMADRTDHLIYSRGLGDWCPATDTTPVELTSTGYFYCDTVLLSKISELLGRSAEARRYTALASNIKQVFNQKFFDENTGIYANGTQTAQSCPLFHDLAEPKDRARVFERLLKKIERDDFHLNTGILGTKYLMQVLTDFGRVDIAWRIATQRTFPSWGYWLEKGATALWEHWDGIYSRNHIMFGDISAWFYKALGGINIDPVHPGFKHMIIQPNPVGDLTYVRAEYNSIRGKIVSHWRREKDHFHLELIIPGNATATVFLPGRVGTDVSSGHHTFECLLG